METQNKSSYQLFYFPLLLRKWIFITTMRRKWISYMVSREGNYVGGLPFKVLTSFSFLCFANSVSECCKTVTSASNLYQSGTPSETKNTVLPMLSTQFLWETLQHKPPQTIVAQNTVQKHYETTVQKHYNHCAETPKHKALCRNTATQTTVQKHCNTNHCTETPKHKPLYRNTATQTTVQKHCNTNHYSSGSYALQWHGLNNTILWVHCNTLLI